MPTLLGHPVQRTLFDALPTGAVALEPHRRRLDGDSWVDLQRSWVRGADSLFASVVAELPWSLLRRPMYDRMVDVPRLTAFVSTADASLPPVMGRLTDALGARYGVDFDMVGANLYRSGSDSVAWHRDRIGRRHHNPIIAIVSLGGTRRFSLRPVGGGQSTSFDLATGDLLVMGGATQHRWEHSVPKVAVAPPRVSLTFRHDHELGRLYGADRPRTGM